MGEQTSTQGKYYVIIQLHIKEYPDKIFAFLMTDSICHSSLPRMVLEKVTLTTIQFRIHPCTKVDPCFNVCILVRH